MNQNTNETTNGNKQKFFLFIDSEILHDDRFLRDVYGPFYTNHIQYPISKQDSVDAFNTLLKSLESKYDVKLVVIDERRANMADCTKYLSKQLQYEKPIFAIKCPSEISRGNGIVDYMKSENASPFEYPTKKGKPQRFLYNIFYNKDFKNYVVLTTNKNKEKVSDVIPSNQTIITNHKMRALKIAQVEKFLADRGIEIIPARTIPEEQKNED